MGNKASGKGKKDPTVLTDEDIRILKLNTQYSEEEIQAWHSGFLKDCPSGKLDKKQFLNVYKVRFFLKEISYFICLFYIRNFIQRVKLINIVILYLKHLILTIIIGLILQNFCKKNDFDKS
jgi:hypothetical protein